jgi:hypothetical protein
VAGARHAPRGHSGHTGSASAASLRCAGTAALITQAIATPAAAPHSAQ